jgi:hypothetical protein
LYDKLEDLLNQTAAEIETLEDDGHGDLNLTRTRVRQAIQRVERLKARLPATEETTVTTSDAIVGGSGTTDAPEDLVVEEPKDDVVVTGESESPFVSEDSSSAE